MDWGWLTGGVRIIERIADALKDIDLPRLEPSVEWHFNSRRGGFDFSIEMNNRLDHSICIESVRLLEPANGALRLDSHSIIILEEDEYSRDRWLGKASTVMAVDQDIDAGQKAWIQFVFVPPSEWLGGDFACQLQIVVKRAKEARKRITIQRSLVK